MVGKFSDGASRHTPVRIRQTGRRAVVAMLLAPITAMTLFGAPVGAMAASTAVATVDADAAVRSLGPNAIVIPGNSANQSANAQANAYRAALGAPATADAPIAAAPQPAANTQFQNPESIRQSAERFLRQQAQGLPGRVTIAVGDVVSDRMPACPALEPFMPPGARLWGTTTVGVRCSGDRPWTLYLQARVNVSATYFVAARQINPGDTIGPQDLSPRQGDLTVLPRTVATDAGQIVGMMAVNRITAGLPIRSDLLRSAIAVQQGQVVRVVSRGDGFEVSTEGQVLQRASAGDPVQVRTRSGQVISGTVKTSQQGGIEVEVAL